MDIGVGEIVAIMMGTVNDIARAVEFVCFLGAPRYSTIQRKKLSNWGSFITILHDNGMARIENNRIVLASLNFPSGAVDTWPSLIM